MRRQSYYRAFWGAAAVWWLALPAQAAPAATGAPLWLQWLIALAAILLGGLSGWLLRQARRRLQFFIGDRGFDLWLKLLFGGLQAAVWLAILWAVVSRLDSFNPVAQVVTAVVTALMDTLVRVLQVPVLTIDKTRFPLSTLLLLPTTAFVVFWAVRAIGQLLKRLLLARLNLNVGTQEALTTAFNYTLTSVGYLLLLQTVGIDLGSIGILLGVVGLGLGFALQNLARSYIGGLVLLVERPIQVGDYVVVRDWDGIVESTSLRTTTLRRFDGSRLVLPNASLVDQDILNWSNLEGRVRLTVEVLVDRRADPQLVTEILLKVAEEELRVLYSPPPEVIFRGYDNLAMRFDLWAWCNYPKEQLRIKSALLYKIDAELRTHNITYPIAQHTVELLTALEDAQALQKTQPQPNGKG